MDYFSPFAYPEDIARRKALNFVIAVTITFAILLIIKELYFQFYLRLITLHQKKNPEVGGNHIQLISSITTVILVSCIISVLCLVATIYCKCGYTKNKFYPQKLLRQARPMLLCSFLMLFAAIANFLTCGYLYYLLVYLSEIDRFLLTLEMILVMGTASSFLIFSITSVIRLLLVRHSIRKELISNAN